MPAEVVNYYISQIARVGRAFFTVNKPYNFTRRYRRWQTLVQAIKKHMAGFKTIHDKVQMGHPRGKYPPQLWFYIALDGTYQELYLQKKEYLKEAANHDDG